MKIGFYVSNNATRLIKTLEILRKKSIFTETIDFVLIDNIKNSILRKTCNDTAIELIEINLENIEKSEHGLYISDFLLENMFKREVDYLIIFCDKILKGDLLKRYRNRIINFHPSILPSHRGLMAIDRAIKENSFLLGNTAHFVDEGIDTGPVIMQSLLHWSEYKTYDDVLDLQIPMLIQIMTWIKDERIILKDNKVCVEGANYSVGRFIPKLEIKL